MPLRSYRVDADRWLILPRDLWQTLHEADLVDELSEFTSDMFFMIVEFLMEERVTNLSLETDIVVQAHSDKLMTLFVCLSRHDARVLHSRINKHRWITENDRLDVFDAYVRGFPKSKELSQAAIAFLRRQHQHLLTDNDLVVIVAVDN